MQTNNSEKVAETLSLIQFKLRNFRKIKTDHWNFSCPICGDSEKNKSKARGYIYVNQHDKDHWYHCKNCGYHKPYKFFLRDFDSLVYSEYLLDDWKHPKQNKTVDLSVDIEKIKYKKPVSLLSKISDPISTLPRTHPARQYIKKRLIPESRWDDLYYIEDIKNVEQLCEKYKDKIKGHESRIGIPYRNKDGQLVGISLRSLDPNHPIKYMHLKFSQHHQLIYNIENIDWDKRVYVLEGQFDSMFFENAVAVSGSGFGVFVDRINTSDIVIIHDNEPRHKETLALIKKSINIGYNVTLLPHSIKSKDINNMIQHGEITLENLNNFIDKHTYSGIRATLEFKKWRILDEG